MSTRQPRLRHWKAPAAKPKGNGTPFQNVALLLQGGGALGAYQAGVYEALAERDITPGWIAGISIGAINSAIIAGNPPRERIGKLRAFWEGVSAHSGGWGGSSWGDWLPHLVHNPTIRGAANQLAAGNVLVHGAPGFFSPRLLPPAFHPSGSAGATSWYDTTPLKATLERLVDFDRINARETRFSVGAVNVRTGNFAYFDNETDTIRPEHIMASGALPPGFPPVEVDGEHYWDGGLVSNTPLDWVLSSKSDLNTLVFQVDLWSARGQLPADMPSVAIRAKEIQYSSRTRAATEVFRERQMLRAAFRRLAQGMTPEQLDTPEAKLLMEATDAAAFNIVQLVYHSPTYEGESKDYEFSRQTMEDHWRTGYQDAQITLSHKEVLELPADPAGVEVYDFTGPLHDDHGGGTRRR
ncbi:MAG: patatin-like phospholipase family protein [Sphingomonadales bacterium]|nr:patatin-like phospholipase family protein [Sphingomonadales bacterium]MDE2171603.1 patatin-like phospholipase family protein [Sphingomonadales bacterium]